MARLRWLLLILAVIFLLRLPSFFEPYWYGDEGIYLAIGQAVARGAILYRDIWDNKPPLLYLIYAVHPTLLWAKISATLFVLATMTGIYFLGEKILLASQGETLQLRKERPCELAALGASLLAGTLLSLPLLEGTIANAELYFTSPIVLSALLVLREIQNNRSKIRDSLMIGLLLSVAFLLKIPAVFDFVGLFLALIIIQEGFRKSVKFLFPICLIGLISLISLTVYFYLNHALSDFLTASFSQNAAYVAVDTGPFSKLSNPLFVKGAVLGLVFLFLIFMFSKKLISKEFLLLALWFGFSLYGALLSNRPYMHYLLQIIPPAALLLIYLLANIQKYYPAFLALFLLFWILAKMFNGAFALDSGRYYQNWFDYVSERKFWGDYANFFDSRTLNSYTVSDFIRQNTQPNDPIFVWGDAAFIYVLSERQPATKFIQAHHLTTIDPVNYSLVMQRLQKYPPKYILISRPERFPFPALDALVAKNYRLVGKGLDLYIYQNIGIVSPNNCQTGLPVSLRGCQPQSG